MRFFHLSDLHIGLRLVNRDIREDQEYIFAQIGRLAQEQHPDAIIIAGDIYNLAVPSAEAVEIFDGFLRTLTEACPEAEIMMISGNHDSAQRVNIFRNILQRQHIHMIGMPPMRAGERIEKVTLSDTFGKVNFYLLPFVRPSMVKEITGTDENGNNLSYDAALHRLIAMEEINPSERNVLVSHQFYLPEGTSPEEVERAESEIPAVGNIDRVCADALEVFDYAALGHIHKPMKVGNENFRYCGTPLACSASEAGQQKAVLLVEMGPKGQTKVTPLPLHPLRAVRKVRGSLTEVLMAPSEDFVQVTLTDKADLDVFDLQDRIRNAFPNLLEIRRETVRKADYRRIGEAQEEMDPLELCMRFLGEQGSGEEELLRDVINTVKRAQEGNI